MPTLHQNGQGIDLVTSGDVANSLLKRHEYDLILLDLNLPNLNGEQILKLAPTLIETAPVPKFVSLRTLLPVLTAWVSNLLRIGPMD